MTPVLSMSHVPFALEICQSQWFRLLASLVSSPFRSTSMSNVDKLKQEEAIARVPSLHSIYNNSPSQHGSHTTLASLDHQAVFTPGIGLIPKNVPRHVNAVGDDHADHGHSDDDDDDDALQLNWQTVVSTDNDVSMSSHVNK